MQRSMATQDFADKRDLLSGTYGEIGIFDLICGSRRFALAVLIFLGFVGGWLCGVLQARFQG